MVGNVKNEIGVLFSKDNFMLIKKKLKKMRKLKNIITKMKRLFLRF